VFVYKLLDTNNQMNSKYKTIAIIIPIIMFLIYYFEYRQPTSSPFPTAEKTLNKLNTSALTHHMQEINRTKEINKLWGIKEKPKTTLPQKENAITVKQEGTTLCIEKSCFKLLGVISEHNQSYASFYNADNEPKIQNIREGELLHTHITLSQLTHNNITLMETNSSRQWSFKLFDVNISKYQPKESE